MSWSAIAAKLPPPYHSADACRVRHGILEALTEQSMELTPGDENEEGTDRDDNVDSPKEQPALLYNSITPGQRKVLEGGHSTTKIHHTISRDANWAASLLPRSKHLRKLTQDQAQGRADGEDEYSTDRDSDKSSEPELPYVYSTQGLGKASEAGDSATKVDHTISRDAD